MRNARQFDTREFDIRIGRFAGASGRHRRPVNHQSGPAGPVWPAPACGYLEATGRDERGHLLLTVVPVRAQDHLHQY